MGLKILNFVSKCRPCNKIEIFFLIVQSISDIPTAKLKTHYWISLNIVDVMTAIASGGYQMDKVNYIGTTG
jgi:hypothetical protein